jgi:hypothetical protein
MAVKTLAAICGNERAPASARVAAAAALLDRGWGKPTQRQEIAVSADLSAALERLRRVQRAHEEAIGEIVPSQPESYTGSALAPAREGGRSGGGGGTALRIPGQPTQAGDEESLFFSEEKNQKTFVCFPSPHLRAA